MVFPGARVASEEFQVAAAAQIKALGCEPALVWVDHPIQNRTDTELAQMGKRRSNADLGKDLRAGARLSSALCRLVTLAGLFSVAAPTLSTRCKCLAQNFVPRSNT